MVLAKELVDKLKKIEDFDITYESSDKDSGEIYIDYNNIVFVLEHYIYEGKFYLSGGLHTITYKGKEYFFVRNTAMKSLMKEIHMLKP